MKRLQFPACRAGRAAGWGLAAILAACAAAPPPTQDLTADDIAQYRFGMYRDCVESGAQSGAPPDFAAAFCDCAYETLGQAVPDTDWRLAVHGYLMQRPAEEQRVLAPYMARLSACRAQAPAPLRDVTDPAAYLGRWIWADVRANCREDFDFGADGTLRVESGDERTVNTYKLAQTLNAAGRLELKTTVTETMVGRNCAGRIEDLTGQSRTLFVEPGPLGTTIAVCESPTGPDCTGPLRKEMAAPPN